MSKQKITVMPSSAGYNLAAHDYDKKEKYLNSFEKDKLIPLLGVVKGKKILDVGAGTGRAAAPLAKMGAEVTALDISPKMLEQLMKKIHPHIQKVPSLGVEMNDCLGVEVKTVVGDAESLPFPDKSFDAVVAAFLIVHLKDPARFFDEAYRVLKDGGALIVSNINQKEPPEVKTPAGVIKIESYYHRPEKIREILESLAFDIKNEIFVKENDVWVNQIIAAQK